jgi:2-octaprenyl-3-methyl-6-methoxy-1,4-benzoquinol hydroxylase
VLVGDAAHVVHPLAGQGVNLGLRDVASLRRHLEGAGDLGAPVRLARHERVRRSESAVMAFSVEGLNRLFSNEQPLATLLRGPLLGIAGRLPLLRSALWRRAAGG